MTSRPEVTADGGVVPASLPSADGEAGGGAAAMAPGVLGQGGQRHPPSEHANAATSAPEENRFRLLSMALALAETPFVYGWPIITAPGRRVRGRVARKNMIVNGLDTHEGGQAGS
ncbi:MAG: hypothetical protein M3O46_21665 [Myxococcota bacterium]|nr:hypothetical protein [Myxococcota bacterium]